MVPLVLAWCLRGSAGAWAPSAVLSMASMSKVTSWSSMAAGAVTSVFQAADRRAGGHLLMSPYSTLLMTHWPELSHVVTGDCRKGWECLSQDPVVLNKNRVWCSR